MPGGGENIEETTEVSGDSWDPMKEKGSPRNPDGSYRTVQQLKEEHMSPRERKEYRERLARDQRKVDEVWEKTTPK